MRAAAPGLLVLVPLVAWLPFAGALDAEFVHFDDYRTVVENPHWRGFDAESLRWMFGEFHNGHYHPLTWLSFAVDHALWGLDPRGFHLTNLVLHALNAALVARVLRAVLRSAGWNGAEGLLLAAAAGALFFAWHPMRVESVAWVTERRDLLSSVFWLGTVALYLSAHAPPRGAGVRRRLLALAFVAYLASLLSKAWGITLPAVLLLLDARPLRRLLSARLVLEKLPFVALALVFASLTAMAQSEKAALTLEQHSLGARLLQAGYGVVYYPLRTILPLGLAPLHPIAGIDFGAARFVAASLAAVAIPVALALARRTGLLVAWSIYFVVVSPVLGLLQSGPQLVAERYSYLSCLPFAALAAAAFLRAWRAPRARAACVLVTLLVLGAWAALTVRGTRVWRDSESLWQRVVERYPDHFRSHFGLAGAYLRTGRLDEAVEAYRRCAELAPDLYEPWAYLGLIEYRTGDPESALEAWRRAYRVDARPEAIHRMALVNAALGRPRLVLEFCAQLERAPSATPERRAAAAELAREARRALETGR